MLTPRLPVGTWSESTGSQLAPCVRLASLLPHLQDLMETFGALPNPHARLPDPFSFRT